MNDRASHRAAVEAGYASLANYVEKYGSEPEYPGASIRTVRMVRSSTGELGEVRLMDYGSGSKRRYRVACFCPGRTVLTPGDTPKVEPEVDMRDEKETAAARAKFKRVPLATKVYSPPEWEKRRKRQRRRRKSK